MTYCLAWKKEKNIFMIADSAVSAITDEIGSEINTFGEIQGLYGKHVVQEGLLKIYKVSEDLVLCFSGNIDLAYEVINDIDNIHKIMKPEEWMQIIKNTYEGCDIEIIIAIMLNQNKNELYYFDGDVFKEVEKIEIGNGKTIINFSKDVNSMVDHFYTNGIDRNDYLAIILGAVQCYSYRNKTFSKGVGGTFAGIIVDTKIKWFRDLEYYIFDDNIRNGSTMSVIARRDSVFSSSDLDGGIRYFINHFKDSEIWDDLYIRHSISKSLNTKNSYYYFFYNIKYNVIAFLKVNGQTQNIHFRRWIRRDNEHTYYAYSFNPQFEAHFELFDSSKERMPSLLEMEVIKDRYIPHNKISQYCNVSDIERVLNEEDMDFDYNEMEYKNYDIRMIQEIKKTIEEYHNLILIDFSYFCDAVDEKIIMYSPIRKCSIKDLDLSAIVDTFLKQMVPDEFIKYRIVVAKDINSNRIISGYDMKDFFSKYENCVIIENDKVTSDFCGTLFELMKNFYLNDAFFHLDKFIIVSDDIEVNNTLMQIIPKFNFVTENPDILLVRNINGLTNMCGSIRYIVIDYLVVAMLGIPTKEYLELESLVYAP